MTVGRKRVKNLHCPPGVREVGGRWYYQPTSARERAARREAKLPATVPLGPAGEQARKKWAELAGYRDRDAAMEGYVAELVDEFERAELRLNRATGTIEQYVRSLRFLRQRFGHCRYGKTEFDASRGKALGTVDIQRFLSESKTKVGANRHVATFSAVFAHAKRIGLTTYNPCEGVRQNREQPRERDVQPWEVECLIATAEAHDALLALLIRFERVCGWRPSDMRLLRPTALTSEGVRLRQAKRGRRQLWEWTPALRAIFEEAKSLPGAKVVSIKAEARYVFPNRHGRVLTLGTLGDRWRRNLARTNALLAEGGHGVQIAHVQLRDLRPMAGKLAAERGESRSKFLGNDPATADKHYTREEQRVRPNE